MSYNNGRAPARVKTVLERPLQGKNVTSRTADGRLNTYAHRAKEPAEGGIVNVAVELYFYIVNA